MKEKMNTRGKKAQDPENSNQDLEKRIAELALLNRLSAAMSKSIEFEKLIITIGDEIRKFFDVDSTLIMRLDRVTGLIHVIYAYDKGDGYQDPLEPIQMGKGLSSKVIMTGKPLIAGTLDDEISLGAYLPEVIEKGEDFLIQSWLGVPLIATGEVLGLVALADMKPNAFNENHLHLLETLSVNIGFSMENARLFSETEHLLNESKHRSQELDIINKIQDGLASKLDMQAIYDLVGDQIQKIFNADSVLINTFDNIKKTRTVNFTFEEGKRFIYEGELPFNKLCESLISTREVLVINEYADLRSKEFGLGTIPGTREPKSMIFVPLISGSEVNGFISLQDVERENAFSASDTSLLTTLASSMSVALENARLFEESQHLLKETEQRAAELAIINSVQKALSSKLDFQGVIDAVGDKIRELFPTDGFGINLLDHTRTVVRLLYIFEVGQRFPPTEMPLGKGLSSIVINSGEPLILNSDMEHKAFHLSAVFPASQDTPKSWLGIPIIVGNETIGNIVLQTWERENAYSESDVRLLQTIASSLGIALDNASLFDETQRLLEKSEQHALELAIINSVQESLVQHLELQGIVDMIGEKVNSIFRADTTMVALYDAETDQSSNIYYVDCDTRTEFQPGPIKRPSLGGVIVDTLKPVLLGSSKEGEKLGSIKIASKDSNIDKNESYLGVPILSEGKAIGMISVQSYSKNVFKKSDLRLLQTLANSMSVALENARLFDETQRLLKETEERNAELAVINSVQAAMAAELNIDGIYQVVGEKIREIFNQVDVGIRIIDQETNLVHYPFVYEHGQQLNLQPTPLVDSHLTAYLTRTRETIVINENMRESIMKLNTKTSLIPGTDIEKSAIYVPLVSGNQVLGLIDLADMEKEHAFSDSDVRLLQTLANSMSVALENARLFNETQHLLKETEEQAADLSVVNTISSALASELNVDTLINLVGEQTRTTFNADVAYVALLDEENGVINFPYTYGEKLTSIKFGDGLTSTVLRSKAPLLLNDETSRKAMAMGDKVIGRRSMSYLGVPIIVGGKAVGVLSVQSTKMENSFDQDDVRLLTTVASHVSTALQNAQLFTEAHLARAEAEQANHTKSAFLANMSHELRTPLNAIIGFTRIVKRKAEGVLPDKQTENLDKVLISADHLLNLINTVLDISKIEAGRMEVVASNFRLNDLLDLCVNTVQTILRPGVTCEKQFGENLPAIHSDQDKIRQILLNLMSNAAKFTHKGTITLSVKYDDDNVMISVADSGIGISPEALPRIFNEFQQADSSTTRQYGGTGLGLSISRNMAQLLGGDLQVESELGKGSIFTLVTPLHYQNPIYSSSETGNEPLSASGSIHEETESLTISTNASTKRILIIDDDPDAVYLMKENLDNRHYEVIGSREGRDGVLKAQQFKPDAILLDILMPDEDGWQVLTDLKENPATTNIPVILLTIVDKKALGLRLGASAYLLKPFDPAAVTETLERLVGKNDGQKRHLLVVDDDPNIADMLRQYLPESKFKLDSAVDGLKGLEAVRASKPDVILLDLIMPNLDGFGFIEQLRADPMHCNLPIIVISSKELTSDEAAQLKASVTQVMKKQGFQGDQLIDEINHVLESNGGKN